MRDFIIALAARSPSARMWYPFLALFLVACTAFGAWKAGLESAVISSAEAQVEIKSIIKHIPDNTKQLKAIGDIRI